jgi:hypothetical protein
VIQEIPRLPSILQIEFDDKKSYHFAAETEYEKEKWILAVSQASTEKPRYKYLVVRSVFAKKNNIDCGQIVSDFTKKVKNLVKFQPCFTRTY